MIRSICTGMLLAAACSSAFGGVVVYRNTGGQLAWNPVSLGFLCPGQVTNNYLDITLPASQDADVQSASSIAYDVCTGVSSNDCAENLIRLAVGEQVVRAAEMAPTMGCNPGQDSIDVVRMHQPGELIGPDSLWAGDTAYAYSRQSGGQFVAVTFPGALGIRFVREGATHYGFVVLSEVGTPTAWGWETTPDTPIAVASFGCPADWNEDGGVTSQDFFDFLAAFFTGNADFNADGQTTSQDFFDFIAAFFGGC